MYFNVSVPLCLKVEHIGNALTICKSYTNLMKDLDQNYIEATNTNYPSQVKSIFVYLNMNGKKPDLD